MKDIFIINHNFFWNGWSRWTDVMKNNLSSLISWSLVSTTAYLNTITSTKALILVYLSKGKYVCQNWAKPPNKPYTVDSLLDVSTITSSLDGKCIDFLSFYLNYVNFVKSRSHSLCTLKEVCRHLTKTAVDVSTPSNSL